MTRFELIGWLLFTGSACFYVAAGIKSGDVLGLAGSALFLVACFFFMAPRRQSGRTQQRCTEQDDLATLAVCK